MFFVIFLADNRHNLYIIKFENRRMKKYANIIPKILYNCSDVRQESEKDFIF